ncbi:BLUF domain-containing protein [Sphingobium phenoxybenzoativorans]|uniref:BLUF domain-containing protein n=1 Tax=Sphingobium phenoxybenzoativorans TaxID=1592790 RepID=A0A975K6B1_9SPHN|nr:BLUF domain-containing protein [Sphingobium phenoxybenzoativorans]QUT04878.1 BLUF domain-containing protein [Sphingobium phenoxybenzoativorans]
MALTICANAALQKKRQLDIRRKANRSGFFNAVPYGAGMRTGLNSWLYISESTLSFGETPSAIEAIIKVSRSRNATLDVTGALLFSGTRFVQFLEGPFDSISALQASIRNDARHRNVTTLSVRVLNERQFGGWALAFEGESAFVEKVLDKAMTHHQAGSRQGVDSLLTLLKRFS